MKTIYFNTGRQYTCNGQQITATLHDDGKVTFRDHSRGITGEFHILDDVFFNQGTVMSEYDGNRYKQTDQSWRDGMSRDGCNATYVGK